MLKFHEIMFHPLLRDADGTGGGTGGDAPGGGDGGNWWEVEALSDPQRELLTTKGLTTVSDPVEAIARLADMQANAERHMGTPADQLLRKPKADQTLTDWMKGNPDLFGLPDAPDKYDTTAAVKDLPDGVTVDKDLETKVRQVAFDHGVTPDALNALIGAYAGHLGELSKGAETGLSATTEQMMQALETDWGDATKANVAMAQQAAKVVAEAAELDASAMEAMTAVLAEKTGDANVLKLFAQIGKMMGDDVMVSGDKGDGVGFSTSPQEARAQLAELYAPDSPYFKAVAEGNSAVMTEYQAKIDRLTKIAAAT